MPFVVTITAITATDNVTLAIRNSWTICRCEFAIPIVPLRIGIPVLVAVPFWLFSPTFWLTSHLFCITSSPVGPPCRWAIVFRGRRELWFDRCDGEAVAFDVQEGIHHHHAALDHDELGLKLHDPLVGKLYQKGLVVPSESLRIIWASCSRRTEVPATGRRQR